MTTQIDMGDAFELIKDLLARCEALDGASMTPDQENNRDRMRARAKLSNDLIYAGHLARLVEGEILNQYHRSKGVEDVPTISK